MKRLTLITGASSGIGAAAALALAASPTPHHLILLARRQKKLEELADLLEEHHQTPSTLVPLDLTQGDAIDRLAHTVFSRWGKLDALLANAGTLGALMPLHHLSPTTFTATMETNLTANWRLIRAFDPLLKQAETPRAVLITSGAATRPRAFWGAYAVSKAALETLTTIWQQESQETNLQISLFNPGATRTAMRAQAMPGEDPNTLPTPETVAQRLLPLLLA